MKRLLFSMNLKKWQAMSKEEKKIMWNKAKEKAKQDKKEK